MSFIFIHATNAVITPMGSLSSPLGLPLANMKPKSMLVPANAGFCKVDQGYLTRILIHSRTATQTMISSAIARKSQLSATDFARLKDTNVYSSIERDTMTQSRLINGALRKSDIKGKASLTAGTWWRGRCGVEFGGEKDEDGGEGRWEGDGGRWREVRKGVG